LQVVDWSPRILLIVNSITVVGAVAGGQGFLLFE
jgi:hypothetical protein